MAHYGVRSWKSFFEDHAIDPQFTEIYLQYIRRLLSGGLPVIFEFAHLASLLGKRTSYLASVINSSESHYRSFEIRKRRGGVRQIDAPYPALLECQRWINDNILSQVPLKDECNGYVKKRSILTNAAPHLNANVLLKMDLKDFFPSISIDRVICVFQRLGYAGNVSVYLAKISCLGDKLPQGAATSPALSNIIASPMDAKLSQLSQAYNLRYTRYADDMTFSGADINHSFINKVTAAVLSEGFQVNPSKTRLDRSHGARFVTGISVGGERLRLPKHMRREIRQQAYYVIKHGYFSHLAKLKVRKPFYLDSLLGKVRFWLAVEPENQYAKEMEQKLVEVLSS